MIPPGLDRMLLDRIHKPPVDEPEIKPRQTRPARQARRYGCALAVALFIVLLAACFSVLWTD